MAEPIVSQFPWCRLSGEGEDLLLGVASAALKTARGRGPIALERCLRETVAPLLGLLGPAARDAYVKLLIKVSGVKASALREIVEEENRVNGNGQGPGSEANLQSRGPGKEPGDLDADINRCIDDLNETHFVVPIKGQTLVGTLQLDIETGRDQIVFGTFGDLHRQYSHRRVWVPGGRNGRRLEEVGKVWTSHPRSRRYSGVAFAPGQDLPGDWCNLWRGFSVEPIAGDCSLYWELVRDVICAEDVALFAWLRAWMAHTVQRMAELPGSAPVLRGPQGIGKNAFVGWFGRLFGQHYLPVSSMEHVAGRFNGHLRDVLVLFCNEALWGGDRAKEGNLKALITDEYLAIESKGVDLVRVRNYKRIIVGSNHDWAVPRDTGDRRYQVFDVRSTRKEDYAFFGELERQMTEGGGMRALLHDLLHLDLVGFQPRALPDRSAGFDINIRSASTVVQWWHELLDQGWNTEGIHTPDGGRTPDWWDENPTARSLFDSYRRWCERMGKKHVEIAAIWAKELKRYLPHAKVNRAREKTAAGSWSTGPRRWRLGELDDCRSAFQEQARVGPGLWDDGIDEDDARVLF
ncbi:MAG: primase-helicase family protein [Deferrisomatales bacterium]